MKVIEDLLSRDLDQGIEEIIQVDQYDEQTVYSEITEYVATDRIKEDYRDLLKAIAEAPTDPHEGVGIWISGFFGSGKSSFAKNLGYVLANPQILGYSYSELFKAQLADDHISEYVEYINTRTPSEVIMLDISKASEVKRGDEKIAEVIYRALLSKLDYAMDYDIADLEIELEEEGRLDQFIGLCPEVNGIEWNKARKGAKKINYASTILYKMDPEHFPHPDTWAVSNTPSTLTVENIVERSFDLMMRRRPGKALVFIIDEVGQYVARSADRIEDLRALVERFGKVSKNRIKAKEAVAPVWIAVTSQEKLDEIVAAIDSKRVELAKLQDRFKYRIDLAPSDIREVAARRVLAKKEVAIPLLETIYNDSQGQLNLALHLERTARKCEIRKDDFVQCYPYPPHFVEISIDIMSGIRLQPGADRHLGGSNRTIIKQAHEMLVNERTELAEKPVGCLVTIDKIFDLVEGNLSTEKRKDLADIFEIFENERSMASRVAKVVCLLEFIRDLPRTEANIAACMVDEIGVQAPLADVGGALKRLQEAKFIRETEDGWKLQTAQEKNWETERRSLEPKPRDRNELLRDALRDIFNEPGLKSYRFQKLKTFNLGVNFNGSRIIDPRDGQVYLYIFSSDDVDSFQTCLEETRNESRLEGHKNDIYFIFSLTLEIDELVADLYSSKEMMKKYDQLRGQNRITREEAASLEDEKKEVIRKQSRLRDLIKNTLQGGSSVFRGVSRDGSDLGKSLESMIKNVLDGVILDLYPRLPIWAKPLNGKEADELLKAANLKGLPLVFYNGEQGMDLIIKDGQKLVLNSNAEVVLEVLQHLDREHSYGNKDTRTGKALETHFGGIGYGGDQDMLRLVLAALFRAGMIEVAYGGLRFESYQEPASHEAFTKITTFRSALFTPAPIIGIEVLTKAVASYEKLSGEMVDVDKNSIASALKAFAGKELEGLMPVEAKARANHLPVTNQIDEIKKTLTRTQKGAADECAKILVEEGDALRNDLSRIRKIREATSDKSLGVIRHARLVSADMWPILKDRLDGKDSGLEEKAERLRSLLHAEDFYDRLADIEKISSEIASRYAETYDKLHGSRMKAAMSAMEDIKRAPLWPRVEEGKREGVLRDLSRRACSEAGIAVGELRCSKCNANVPQMESDLAAIPGFEKNALEMVRELTQKKAHPEGEKREKNIVRVRISDFFSQPLDSREAVESSLKDLQDHLLKLLEGNVEIILE